MDDDEDAVDPIVPAGFTQATPKRLRVELKPFTFDGLKGERVIVRANGFEYRGVLIGADEGELYLRGDQQSLVMLLQDVTSIERDR